MERKKCLFIVFFCFVLLLSFAQNNKTIYQAYLVGDMAKWKTTMDSIEALPNKLNSEKLDLINYHYGYIAWCIDKKKTIEAEKYIAKSELLISQLELKKYGLSKLNAYKAAFVGFKIGISPYKAPFIGQESLAFAKKAASIDSLNAFAFIQLGNIAYYTPSMFGGSKKQAMQYYVKALKLMEMQIKKGDTNWNYLNLLTTIIHAYMDLNQYKMARYYCVKTLAVEPEFDWVKNKLYPQVINKLKQ